MSFKRHLFAKIIRENDQLEKQKKHEEKLTYWDKFRANKAANED